MSDNNQKIIYNYKNKDLVVLNTDNKVIFTNNEPFYNLPSNVLENPTLFLGKDYSIIDDSVYNLLPKPLIYFSDYVNVLKYYLLDFYEIINNSTPQTTGLIKKLHLPSILNERYGECVKYINEHRVITININFL